MSDRKPSGPRSIALVGPYQSGKTTLLESLLFAAGGLARKGSVGSGTSFGDASPEARAHKMSVEINPATFDYLDESFTVLDCPGSVEFQAEAANVLVGVDAAVVVCEPDLAKVASLGPLLHLLDEIGLPRFIFVNKIDKAVGPVRDLLAALQPLSRLPLVLREVPIREGGEITGYVDLASERAYVYRDNAPAEIINMPPDIVQREAEARYAMLEKLADFDDRLLESLLEDRSPEAGLVFSDLAMDLQAGVIVPVFFGAAETGHGVNRLLKALRHEVPQATETASRVGIDGESGQPLAQVLKTYVTAHAGKLSLVRVWAGHLTDTMVLNGERLGGIQQMRGSGPEKRSDAGPGEVVALGRLEQARTQEALTAEGETEIALPKPPPLQPVFGLAITALARADEVRLPAAVAKLVDEDPGLELVHNPETREMVLWGQGNIHLKVALERLQNRHGIKLSSAPPRVSYRETIRKSVVQPARHKRQSGGHGQFADVTLGIRPLQSGEGFIFENRTVGGVVPKNFIPAVEAGVRDYLAAGTLGFPVVDVAVALTDGAFHAVDSSEMAFKVAARLAMSEGMAKCDPLLLEPIFRVEVAVPSDYTARVNSLLSGRRGQILGFDARPGWNGWDRVNAYLPEAELHDLIVELRSATQGVGSYSARFDHLRELTGRLAEQVLANRPAV